ncbi:MAG TPA: flagellar FlbD family protein [Symbiobacteriaceae bacterium]
MIKVTKLRAQEPELVVNAELIETVEATPDTVITLTTGHKIIVHETVDEIIRMVVAYQRTIREQRSAGSGS